MVVKPSAMADNNDDNRLEVNLLFAVAAGTCLA
jgi:hypothetical protein